MVEDNQHARVAVVETRLNHLEAYLASRFQDLKALIEREASDRKAEKEEERAERRARAQREWSMIIAVFVAALGFLMNLITRKIGL